MTQRRDLTQEIYRLLPAVHQIRDAGQQHSLKHLLTVISEQVQLIHDDIEQLYDNWFIETCDDWVVPYIADLVGVTSTGSVASVSDPRAVRFAFPRREIANTVRRRRRKGTLSVLEDLAFDIAGWKARAVDFSERVICTPASVSFPTGTCSVSGKQSNSQTCGNQPSEAAAAVRHSVKLPQEQPTTTANFFGHTPDLRQPDSVRRAGTPFDKGFYTPHFGDLQPYVPQTWYGVGKLGLFVWRREIVPITRGCLAGNAINPFGCSLPLYVKPDQEEDVYGIAEERHLPVALTRHLLADEDGHPREEFYGAAKSLHFEWKMDNGEFVTADRRSIRVVGIRNQKASGSHPIYAASTVTSGETTTVVPLAKSSATSGAAASPFKPARSSVTSGTAAFYEPPINFDPETGQFETDPNLQQRLRISCHHAVAGRIGGGEYTREHGGQNAGLVRISQRPENTMESVVDLSKAKELSVSSDGKLNCSTCIEFSSSETIFATLNALVIPAGKTFELRARAGHRPVVHLMRPLRVDVHPGGRLIVNGLTFTGANFEVRSGSNEKRTDTNPACAATSTQENTPAQLQLSHSTLSLTLTSSPATAGLSDTFISDSIVRQLTIRTEQGAPAILGRIRIQDSVVEKFHSEESAGLAPVGLSADRVTFLKAVKVDRVDAANDCIFAKGLRARQTQAGFVRYSYIAERAEKGVDCQTPMRFRCVSDRDQRDPVNSDQLFFCDEYGHPGFAQLRLTASEKIRRGAESESEMGAFHNQFAPQLEARLEQQLEEFTPAERTSRVIYVEELEHRRNQP